MLDDELLESYINGFYGYGSYSAPYWFIGMEPGGEVTLEQIEARLKAWDERGSPELESLGHYDKGIQKTWGGLIKIQFAIESRDATPDLVRSYQQSYWGKLDSETCLMELLPLPSPNAYDWAYPGWSSLTQLRSRSAYVLHYASRRTRLLRTRIREHKPKAVVFYGSKYLHWWQAITVEELKLTKLGKEKIYLARNGPTLFVAIKHVTAMGTSNEYLESLGQMIAESLG